MKVTQLCPTLCDPMDWSLPDSSVHGILQARIPEWVDYPFSKGSSQPGTKPRAPALQADSLPAELPEKPLLKVLLKDIIQEGKLSDRPVMLDVRVKVLAAQSCLTLCDPTNCNPPGSSLHGNLQARILEWVAIPFSSGSSQGLNPGLLHWRQILCRFFADSLLPKRAGKKLVSMYINLNR